MDISYWLSLGTMLKCPKRHAGEHTRVIRNYLNIAPCYLL